MNLSGYLLEYNFDIIAKIKKELLDHLQKERVNAIKEFKTVIKKIEKYYNFIKNDSKQAEL